jgi:hypothetical protein
MAGSSMTFSYDDGADGIGFRGRFRKVIADWVSDDSTGAVTGTTRKIIGRLIKIVTDPGSAAPTDNYDVTIVDEKSVSVVATCQNVAALGTRHTTTTQETYLHMENADDTPIGMAVYPVVCDALTIGIANAGNSKTGQIILYYEV